MSQKINPLHRLILTLVLLLFYSSGYAIERQNLFDWYYSAVFGTGSYRIGDRDVFVLTVPYESQLRAADEDKNEVMWKLPVTAGFYDYTLSNISNLEIPTDVATLTVLPGIYYVIPLSHNWIAKPFANLGYGKEFEGGEGAWIYSLGIRTLYRTRTEDWRVALGSSLYYAGNTREQQTDLGYAAFDASIDLNRTTGWVVDNQTIYFGGYASMYLFSNLDFIQSDNSKLTIHEQYEVGLTLSASDTVNIMGVNMERVGLGYLVGRGFTAWRLVFSFPY